MLKNEWKIRKWLGNAYHLFTDDKGNWKLFKKYNDFDKYMNEKNKPLMTNENNTEDDLYKLAKKNKKYKKLNQDKALFITILIILWLAVVLSLINFKIDSEFIRGFVFGVDLLAISISIVRFNIIDHNLKISMKEMNRELGFREDFNPFNRWQIKSKVSYGNEDYLVSTADLGLNHSYLNEEEPLYYETMIFRINSKDKTNRFEYYQERYTTKKTAKNRHNEIVKMFKNGTANKLI